MLRIVPVVLTCRGAGVKAAAVPARARRVKVFMVNITVSVFYLFGGTGRKEVTTHASIKRNI
jgi:hypothetical protein